MNFGVENLTQPEKIIAVLLENPFGLNTQEITDQIGSDNAHSIRSCLYKMQRTGIISLIKEIYPNIYVLNEKPKKEGMS